MSRQAALFFRPLSGMDPARSDPRNTTVRLRCLHPATPKIRRPSVSIFEIGR